jgi:hypothetical protein
LAKSFTECPSMQRKRPVRNLSPDVPPIIVRPEPGA